MQQIIELMGVAPAEWTDAAEQALARAWADAVREGAVVRFDVPCPDDETVGHYTVVSRRILEQNHEVILSAGRIWDRDAQVMRWTVEGYPAKVREAIARARQGARA